MPNLPEYAVVFHGVVLAGGVCTTVNPGYTAGEIHDQCLDAGATRLVTVPACLDVARAAAVGTGVHEILVVGGEPAAIAAAAAAARAAGIARAERHAVRGDAAASRPAARRRCGTRPSPDDLVVLPYSSGTTGVSKGVMLTHRNLVANVMQTTALVGLGERDVMMAVLPFFHIYGMQVMMNCGLAAGATLVTMPRFDLELFLRAHQQYRITLLLRRAADRRRARQAPDGRAVRSPLAALHALGRRAAVGARSRRRRASASAARSCRATA